MWRSELHDQNNPSDKHRWGVRVRIVMLRQTRLSELLEGELRCPVNDECRLLAM